jgi:hypothetical protein
MHQKHQTATIEVVLAPTSAPSWISLSVDDGTRTQSRSVRMHFRRLAVASLFIPLTLLLE